MTVTGAVDEPNHPKRPDTDAVQSETPRSRIPLDYLRPENPLRRVDWRWQLARRIVAGDPDAAVIRDETVDRVVAYLAAFGSKPTESVDPWPGLTEAINIKQSKNPDDLPLRVDVEAYLLAGESDVDVSRRFSLSPEVVEAYSLVFFDIRDRPSGCIAIVRSIVLDTDLPLREHNWAVHTRLLGLYLRRPELIDVYRDSRNLPVPPIPRSFSTMNDFELDRLRQRLFARQLALTSCVYINTMARTDGAASKANNRRTTIHATIDRLGGAVQTIGLELACRETIAAVREARILPYSLRAECQAPPVNDFEALPSPE